MAIYHLEAKVVSRGAGRSVVAASAYMSCSRIVNEYDGVEHDYTRKSGLVWQQVFLPPQAPSQWQDRAQLWNAVEEAEKTKDSRLAREIIVALPIEMKQEEWERLLQDYIQKNFVSEGMCADAAIHDTDGHNPHAHILLTVRPLDATGKWQYKTKKEYLCVREGEEQAFTAEEFRQAQEEGWEKQYPYRVEGKKVYLPPSQAGEFERLSKTPRSTRFGRQNPIAARWNSEEQLCLWRESWADLTNRHLEQLGLPVRIDHRTLAAQGIPGVPTIHEGVTARAMEQAGKTASRCEINRQIKAGNQILRKLRSQIEKWEQKVQTSIPALAEVLESLRDQLILMRYELIRNQGRLGGIFRRHARQTELLTEYREVKAALKEKSGQRKELTAQLRACGPIQILKKRSLSQQLAALTEDMEELKTRKAFLLDQMDGGEPETARAQIREMESGMELIKDRNRTLEAQRADARMQYRQIRSEAAPGDEAALLEEWARIRPRHSREVQAGVRRQDSIYWKPEDLEKARQLTDAELKEAPLPEPKRTVEPPKPRRDLQQEMDR